MGSPRANGPVLADAADRTVIIATTASPDSFTAAGQRITYTYTVTNDGAVPLTGITVRDFETSPDEPVCELPGPLDPGDSATCTTAYVTTAADVDRGDVSNVALVVAHGGGRDVSASTSRTILLVGTGAPGVSIAQTASPELFTDAGQEIIYSYTVTNDGAVPLTDASIWVLPNLNEGCRRDEPLDPGDSFTCTVGYVTTAADVERGSVTNAAAFFSRGRGRWPSVSARTSKTIFLARTDAPRVSIAKTATPDSFTGAGQPITYSYTVTNNGAVPLTDITVGDSTTSPAEPVCELPGPLDPGDSATCTDGYVTTAADVNRGSVTNAAHVNARGGGRDVSASASRTIFLARPDAPGVSIAKTASPGSYTGAGQPITYSYTVTNDGAVPLTDITVRDSTTSPGEPVCELEGPLAPTDAATCTAGYVTTAADVEKGSVTNTASVSARGGGRDISASTSRTVFLTSAPGVSLAMTASPGSFADAGQPITYSYTVTNDGAVPLTDISVVDFILFGEVCRLAGPLNPGDSATCTAGYVTTAADVGNGSVTNIAGVDVPSGDRWPAVSATTSRTIFLTSAPGASLDTTASPDSFTDAGQPITYTHTVTNDGAVPLTDITVRDLETSSGEPVCELPGPLNPGDSATCSAGYVTTAVDVDRGSVTNAAHVNARGGGRDISAFTSRTIFLVGSDAPGVSLATTASPGSFSDAGQPITYSYTVTNDGAVPLTGITVDDPTMSPGEPVCELPGPLDPGGSATCTAGYVTTADDVDRGRVSNVASVSARGGGRYVSAYTSRTIFLTSGPVVSIAMTASRDSFTDAGQPITYRYTVTNDGAVRLTDLTVSDFRLSMGEVEVCRLDRPLDPGDSATCTAAYVTSAADVDNGSATRNAFVDARGGGRYLSAWTSRIIFLTSAPGASIATTASPNWFTEAGQSITYSYTVTNDGAVPLTDVTVWDLTTNPATAEVCRLAGPLAPGGSATCTAGYLTTTTDVARGSITNTAYVTARGGGRDISAFTSRTVFLVGNDAPEVSIVTVASPDSYTAAGQRVIYTHTVTNDGNVPLTDITVADSRLGDVSRTCPQTTLAVGAHMDCKARYTTTPTDVANGDITNTATVTGTAPSGEKVSAQAAATVILIQAPPPSPTAGPATTSPTPRPSSLSATGAPASTIWLACLGFIAIIGGLVTVTASRRGR